MSVSINNSDEGVKYTVLSYADRRLEHGAVSTNGRNSLQEGVIQG